MKLVIYGKDQLRKNWYLISLKRLFVTGYHSTAKCTQVFIYFISGEKHPKKLNFLCAERACADLTEQYNKMEQKKFRKALFLVRNFFFNLIG